MSSAIPARPRCRSWTRWSTRPTSLRARPAGGDGGRHGRRLGARLGQRAAFVNLHAMGGLGNAMGVLVASKASETPLVVTAGQQDTRHLMTEPWLSGDLVALAAPVTKWAQGGAARRGCRPGPAPRLRDRPHAAVRAGVPVAADGHPRPGGERPDAAGLRAAAARRPRPTRRASPRRSPALDPDRVVVLLGDDLPAAASAGLVAFAEAGGYPVWGTQLTSRAAFPVRPSLLGGRAEAGFRRSCARISRASQAIVLVGGRAFVAYPYRDVEPVPDGVAVLHVADNPEAFGREHAADMALLGDIGATLAAAAARPRASSSTGARSRRGSPRAARRKRDATAGAARARSSPKPGAPLSPDAAVLAALDALPQGRADRQRFRRRPSAGAGFDDDRARPLFLRPRRRARLQHAGGGRRGARDAADWVVSFVGDGGAMYSPQALWSAARYRARVDLRRVQQPPLRRAAERREAASATPTRSPAGSSAWRSSIRRSTSRRSPPRWACRPTAPTTARRSARRSPRR